MLSGEAASSASVVVIPQSYPTGDSSASFADHEIVQDMECPIEPSSCGTPYAPSPSVANLLPSGGDDTMAADERCSSIREVALPPEKPHSDTHDHSTGDTTSIISIDTYKLDVKFLGSSVMHWSSGHAPTIAYPSPTVWRAVRIIGSGATGEVWLQREIRNRGNRTRAVKQIGRHARPPPMFQREVLLLVKVLHYPEHFVQFLGWYENEHHLFMAMEFVPYGNLLDRIKLTKITELEAKEISRQILRGLEILHGIMICHRDIKPENILVASVDPLHVKITDLGISKEIVGTIARTQCGTANYYPPEIHGILPGRRKRRFTFALDIWSFGCLLHEMLCSETPFICTEDEESSDGEGEAPRNEPTTDIMSLTDYCAGRIDLPREPLERANVSKEVIRFLERLLQPEPSERPTAGGALEDTWLQ